MDPMTIACRLMGDGLMVAGAHCARRCSCHSLWMVGRGTRTGRWEKGKGKKRWEFVRRGLWAKAEMSFVQPGDCAHFCKARLPTANLHCQI